MPRERGKRGSLFSFTTLVLGVVYFLWRNSNHERGKGKKHSAKYRAEEAKRTGKPPRPQRREPGPLFIQKADYPPKR